VKKVSFRKRVSTAIEILFGIERFHVVEKERFYVMEKPRQNSRYSKSDANSYFVLTIADIGEIHLAITSENPRSVNSWPELIGLDNSPLAIAERGKPNLGYKDVVLVRFGEKNYCQWFARAPLGEHVAIGRIMEICALKN
jgi:hypothetical protein